MANICNNEFYAYSDNTENITYLENFFKDYGSCAYDCDTCSIDVNFESRWTFPDLDMETLYEGIPDKTDIYMRCLSVEYGCDYVAYHKCEDDSGWYLIH